MSWLNLNQSLNSLKGQITNFASEVLSEGVSPVSGDEAANTDSSPKNLEEKCQKQELEIEALKKLNEELQATLQSERLARKNGIKDEESSWYWDPPPQLPQQVVDNQHQSQIRELELEISNLKARDPESTQPLEQELIRLREENLNLTSNLEDLDTQHQLAMERLLALKKELQKNFEVLKQEHEDLKNTNNEYSTQIRLFVEKIDEKDREIQRLQGYKTEYETLQHKYCNLEKVHSLLRENAEKFQEENQELHEEVFKLQEQVTKLEHEVEICNKHDELSNFVPRENYDAILKELHELRHRRNSNQMQLDEVNIDDNAKSLIEKFKRDIHELKHQLSLKDLDSDHKKIGSEKIMQLYNKYVNFELPVDYLGEIPASEDKIILFKLESIFKTLNAFKKDIDTLQHKLSEKNHNINHLQTQIDDLTTENDFLTTDIQHYESELNEMKKNNDFLISEIAALKNTSKLEPIIETHEDNIAKLETELDHCTMKNKTFENEILKIEFELAEVKAEKVVLQESLNEMRSKYTVMLEELDQLKNQAKEVQELENSSNTHYTVKLQQAHDEIDALKKKLNTTSAKNEQLSIDIHIIENDKVLLTKEIDDLKHALEESVLVNKELETLKTTLDQKLEDLERRLNEVFTHSHEHGEKNVILENNSTEPKDLNKESELDTIAVQKIRLDEKLQGVLKENSSLAEKIHKLTNDVVQLQKVEQELRAENSTLKNNTNAECAHVSELQETIDDLKAKVIQLNTCKTQITKLKEENHKLSERKLELEGELFSTDKKILHLEEEFDKLIADINEKDTVIDSLNIKVNESNNTIETLNQSVSDLTKTLNLKNDEIQKLTSSIKEIMEKFNENTFKCDKSIEELAKLQYEKEDMSKQIIFLNEEINVRNSHLSALTIRSEELEKTCKEYKTVIENKDKEIKELSQSIIELTDKIKITDNLTHVNDEYAKLVQVKETIEKEVTVLETQLTTKDRELADVEKELTELKTQLKTKEDELTSAKSKSEQMEKSCTEYKTILENATKEKSELINLINLKHNESIQYHTEIQRLNHILLEQTNEFKRIIEEKDALIQNKTENCTNCENLKITLKEKDEIIKSLNQNSTEYETMKSELLKANETIKNLTEKCDTLDKSLAIQLEAVKELTAQNVQLSELEQNSTRELERLRQHLMEMEENYTQELMASEQKMNEVQARLRQVEDRAKQTSTVYTSNSIRANQEVETLRNQIKLMEKQREDVQAKLSEAEDARNRSEAALTNLQVVLEQFQLDKDRDIHAATEKIRNKMESMEKQNSYLQDEIAHLNTKLEESLAGLQAATRLGDQVETKTAQINDLKEQVRTLQASVAAAEERYYNAISNQQDKVDKNLVKNLVINYVQTAAQNSTNKTQVLRILSTVLDFNQQECERLGLVRSANATEGLAVEFIKFLQNESKPRAPLPNMMGLTQGNTSRSSTPGSRRSSTLGPHPNLQDVGVVGHKRNPSTGSNNLLLQNIDATETSSHVSIESDTTSPRGMLDTGVTTPRDTEGAILKHVLRDMQQ